MFICSIVTSKEVSVLGMMHLSWTDGAPLQVIALVSLGPDHLTLSGAVLDQLAAAEADKSLEVDTMTNDATARKDIHAPLRV